MDVSCDNLNMTTAPYRYTSKRIAKHGDPRTILLQWGWGSLGSCSVFLDYFFVVTYTCLSLVLTIDFCYSQLIFFCILFKKYTKINKWKKWKNILKKMNSLKKGEGVPLLNFEGGPGVLLLNFEGGPGVPLLNFRWSRVPLLNFEGGLGSRVPGPRVPRSQVPGSWSHCYTMPNFLN